MTIPKQYLKILTIAVLAGLVVFSVLALILRFFLPGFDPTAYITAISLLAIAVLTIVYVLYASGQLDIMQKQLEELKLVRQLEAQPLPILSITGITMEPPKFFYNPSEDAHSFRTRIRVDFSLRNHTVHPAVNLISAGAVVLKEGKKPIVIRSTPFQLDILPEKTSYPQEDERQPDFMFCSDRDNELLGSLQKKTPELLPLLPVRLLYANILGACFSVETAYRLSPLKQDNEEVLAKWQALIVSFPVEHKDDLHELASMKKDGKESAWKKAFNAIDKKMTEATGTEDLELSWQRLPNSFEVTNISQDEYKNEIKNSGADLGKAVLPVTPPEPEEKQD